MTSAVLARCALVAGLAATGAAGCRSHVGFRQQYLKTRPQIVNGNWGTAAKTLEKERKEVYEEQDRVMYWLNLGTLQHYADQFGESQKNFVQAEKSIQDLFTTSVTSEASKYTISETLAPYEGEDFEKILLYFYTAINNVKLGKISDALVEARRADEFLKKIRVRYDNDKELSTLYKQDAFMLWLVGLFYELEGSYNDAFLAYKRAYEIYATDYAKLFNAPPPNYVAEDVVRCGMRAGLSEDAEAFGRKHGATGQTAAYGEDKGEVILIHAGGEAPYKQQRTITAKMPDNYILRIALPAFKATSPEVFGSRVSIGGQKVTTAMAEPVTSIALKNFKHQLPGINARAIARATAKYLATKGTKALVSGGKNASAERKAAGAIVGLFTNVASAASENADLRAWSYLPAYFRVTRVWVPTGAQTLEVEYLNRSGAKVGSRSIPVNLEAGERKIISIRTVR